MINVLYAQHQGTYLCKILKLIDKDNINHSNLITHVHMQGMKLYLHVNFRYMTKGVFGTNINRKTNKQIWLQN